MKNKKKRYRLLALLMAVSLLAAGLPMGALAAGESGSNTGSSAGGSASSPGSGTCAYSTAGVTMQVVTYPYGSSYERESSYNNVINTVQSGTTALNGATVLDGTTITNNTFMMDNRSGRVYKVPNLDIGSKKGRLRFGVATTTYSIDPNYHECVTEETGGGTSYISGTAAGEYTWCQDLYMPAPNDVELFFQNIILGNGYGSWDIHAVAKDASGNSLAGVSSATSANDVSTFAKVLRYLGCGEDLINNYVKGYSGQLDPTKDANVPIPTIVWSYIVVEVQKSDATFNQGGPYIGNYDTIQYDYMDSTSRMNGKYQSSGFDQTYWCHIYTVGDILGYGNGDSFTAWWKTGYANADASRNSIGCKWPIDSSFGCNLALGAHNHGTYQTQPEYAAAMLGSGYVNSINSGGVDNASGGQYYFRGYWTPYGDITKPKVSTFTLVKSIKASDACIAQIKDNPLYSLAGAQYQVTVDGVVTETLIIDANGCANSAKEYDIGATVNVKETVAPNGYKLDSKTYSFVIKESDNVFSVQDEPLFDPPFAITKIDKDTTTAQGNGSFSGAVFKWEYFANYDWSGTATRTWYFKTNANGYSCYDSAYLASEYVSDNIYYGGTGAPQIPIGSVKITEVKNSLGYIVMPQSLKCTIVADSSSTYGTKIVWDTASWSIITDFSNGNFGVPEPIDETLFGSLTVDKIDSVLGSMAQGGATLKNAKFQVVNDSSNSVKVGDFAEAKPGEVCYEFYTDENGRHSSGNIFPLGKYTVKEVTAPTGYLLNEGWSQSFTVTATDRDFSFTAGNGSACPDNVILGGVRILKQDATLGDLTGGDAWLSGITFSLVSNNAQPVVVNGTTYKLGDTVLTLEIKWDGSQWVVESGNILPYGNYTLMENVNSSGFANDFYEANDTIYTVEVRENGSTAEFTYVNKLRPGKLEIHKIDMQGEPLEGVKFLLEWSLNGENWTPVSYSESERPAVGTCGSADLKDGCLLTDKDGNVVFSNLHPALQYRVTELETVNGYQLLTDFAYVGGLPNETLEVGLEVVNGWAYVLPETGGSGFVFLPVVLATLLLLGSGLILLEKKHRKV